MKILFFSVKLLVATFFCIAVLCFSLQNFAIAGVTVDVIKSGDGLTYPQNFQTVTVHYVGKLENGRKFDSSRDRDVPFSFVLGQGNVIKGWEEGVAKMSLGEISRLTITSDYAYGENGVYGIIPKNATLIFEVELLKIN